MTDKEAIELLKKLDKYDFGDCWEGTERPLKAIETVLNLIQKQQAELEKEKGYYNFVKDIVEKYHDLTHNFLETDIAIIKKKDKIIDLMAEQLTTPEHNKEWVIDYYKRKVE